MSQKVIALVHPSKGRPRKANDTIKLWYEKAIDKDNLRYVLSLDSKESELGVYLAYFKANTLIKHKGMVISPSTNVVEATNSGASTAYGNWKPDILVYLSDDFIPFSGWDEAIRAKFEEFEKPKDTPVVLRVRDGIVKDENRILTIPIMNLALYEKLGYMWHPDYASMWVDNDLYETCDKIGAVKHCLDLLFEHHHWINGLAVKDKTYEQSERHFLPGKQVFETRQKQGFPIDKK